MNVDSSESELGCLREVLCTLFLICFFIKEYSNRFPKRECLNVATVNIYKMHNIGTIPTFKMHNVGTLVFLCFFFFNLDCMKKINDRSIHPFFNLSRLSLFSQFLSPLFNQMGIECSDQKFLLQ